MQKEVQLDFDGDFGKEDPNYLKEQVITYIGNKRSLLHFIGRGIKEVLRQNSCDRKKLRFADVFSGTGVVSRLARQDFANIQINDLEPYSVFTNSVYHTNRLSINWEKYRAELRDINEKTVLQLRPGFITEMYAPANEENISEEDRVFYTRRNAMFIDTARQLMDTEGYTYRDLMLAALIQRASVHTNTSGVFKGFYKNKHGIGQFGGDQRNALSRIVANIDIPEIVLSKYDRQVTTTCKEASVFTRDMQEVDLAYLDPPYNQHPYGSNYFMLNLILMYERPIECSRVSGIPKDWNRSSYNKKPQAKTALFDVLENCKAKSMLLSYNSEGFIAPNDLLDKMSSLGNVMTFDEKYNTFRGCRNLQDRSSHVTEHLFLVERT